MPPTARAPGGGICYHGLNRGSPRYDASRRNARPTASRSRGGETGGFRYGDAEALQRCVPTRKRGNEK